MGKFHASGERENVWRLARSTSPGEIIKSFDLPMPEIPDPAEADFDPGIVVIVDNATGFRHPRGACLPHEAAWSRPETTVVWKMAPPFCRGELWWRAVGEGVPDRAVVIISLDDLRREPVRISKRISWERTALEIARELEHNPTLADLRSAAHVIVTIHGEGALWCQKDGRRFTLFFDPTHMETEWWKSTGAKGSAYGFASVFTSAVSAGLCTGRRADIAQSLETAIPRGLLAMRTLHACGHGPENETPAFPTELLAQVIQHGHQALAAFDRPAFGAFSATPVPIEEISKPDSDWRIGLAGGGRPNTEPLFGLARRVAVFGERELKGIPHARFGQMLTADRNEIEALRNLKTLIENYGKSKETKPLSLAVFGPPGAGKSFGVKQIAKEVLGNDGAMLEFNLSQFDDADLAGAFHQVRDAVLSGKMPVVFWDEFDSSEYKWLKLLLAPMNDGVFQEGQLTHPLGRCIFVFAGGTSCDMEHFGPVEPAEGAGKETLEAWEKFKLLKGPDFMSRLHGSLNVLGPNRRLIPDPGESNTRKWIEDETDVCFPLRRAILLRGILNLKNKRLKMAPGLLSALLESRKYSNGSRSFEKILRAMSGKQDNKAGSFLPSDLPSDAVLSMNIDDLPEFKRLLSRDESFQQLSEKLAPAIHLSYLELAERTNPNRKPYDELPEETKADNLAAAKRIPWLLGFAGLYVTDMPVDDALTADQALAVLREPGLLELLAEEEHDLWMAEKQKNGWLPGARDDAKHTHPLLVPYARLDETQKNKDRDNILRIPERVELAEFSIVARQPSA